MPDIPDEKDQIQTNVFLRKTQYRAGVNCHQNLKLDIQTRI